MNAHTPLPQWANNPEGRALIAAIIAEQPKCGHVPFGDSHYTVVPRYRGASMEALRELYAASGHRAAVFSETPDGLIEMLLEQESAVTDLGDGWKRAAA